ncbi:MAG: hypothetical protein JRJ25_07205 [Deltaproteobacteria bacterium]|nr:hypothetical protein [Deltaproteobacteria bacterium]
MSNYKQEIKEKSRIEIWNQAIRFLTVERKDSRILKSQYIRRLWDYAFDEILKYSNVKEFYIDSWCDFSDSLYKGKSANDLKVAYFCGPEPENDLKIMVGLGIRIENVWAIEADRKHYNSALSVAKCSFPTLKIFHGSFSEFVKVSPLKFDVIYLDFTAPVFSRKAKPLSAIHSIFNNQSLNELGVLVVNSSLPDKNSENIKFLSGYFSELPFVENSLFSGDCTDSDYVEGFAVQGYDFEEYENIVCNNFSGAYSAYLTHYPPFYAGYIQPMHRVSNSSILRKMFFTTNEKLINSSLTKMSADLGVEFMSDIYESNEEINCQGSEIYSNPDEFPFWHFINSLKDSNTKLGDYWYQQYTKKRGSLSYFDAVKRYDLLRNANYNYKEILSDHLRKSIEKIIEALPDKHGGIFCDVPVPHLWVELALNQLGGVYHYNTRKHWRARYRAKKHEMFIDLFLFDKCRALYDWIPMVDLYGEDLALIERQIIIRSCMDAITKQSLYSIFYSYAGANLIGINTKRWSESPTLEPRNEIL